ncbi:hypothetical protein [Erythrobacter sp. THAF29]|uniref:hypothetical protein n=1 Tax=Erythrobacter sp. THAF29 TaxID=2587851 RepID=UPI001267D927|nr:hypothetical protein [Erythrobacter sp. THAF29]QFT78294.1 hypothetical protein FIU90_12155 [Erythrobacter sp. THAF29]
MDILQFTFVAVLVVGALAIVYILAAKPTSGNATLAAMLAGGFGAYTAIQIAQEGVMMFWTNHTVNLTGIQVWWDLVMCVIVALFFIAPRARKVGMNVPLWALFAACTASIGLLAMCARLFWLENHAEAAGGSPAKA